MNNPCICQICNCGRHRCPHHPKQRLPWGPCVMTEYGAQYLQHCLDPVKAIVPESTAFNTNDPLSSETTNRTDYKPNKICPLFQREREQYHPPKDPMESTTMYRNEYIPKLCPPPKSMKPIERASCPAEFEGNPTYRSDYQPWNLPPIERHHPDVYKPSAIPFDGLPTYRSEYVPHCISTRKPMVPISELLKSDLPVETMTNYRQNFVPHEICKKPEPQKALPYKSKAPFDGLTTVQTDFTPKEFCPLHQMRREDTLGKSDDPMSDQTTNRIDYPSHEMCAPYRHHPDPYIKPEGDIELGSSYNIDYPVRELCKTKPIKMPEVAKCGAPFYGETNYRREYQPWKVKPCFVKPDNRYNPPSIPIEGLSTHRAEFIPRVPCKVHSYKPAYVKPENVPFDGNTSYRIEYIKKIGCHCPAAYLKKDKISPDGYVFKAQDEEGHQHYKLEADAIEAAT